MFFPWTNTTEVMTSTPWKDCYCLSSVIFSSRYKAEVLFFEILCRRCPFYFLTFSAPDGLGKLQLQWVQWTLTDNLKQLWRMKMLLVSAFSFHLSFSPYILVIHTSALPILFYPALSVQEWSCPGNPSTSCRIFHWSHITLAPVVLQ